MLVCVRRTAPARGLSYAAAVLLDEWAGGDVLAVAVDSTGYEFLAGATFAGDKNWFVAGCAGTDTILNTDQWWVRSNESVKLSLGGGKA